MPWTVETIAGHPCDVYEPPARNPQGFVVLYLHGVHLNRLDDKPAFVEQFDRYGLPVVAPRTARSWWTDKICLEFDPKVSAERHVRERVLPFIAERFGSEPPRIGLLGTSMGGQGALRLAYKYPSQFPVVAAISPAIDYYKRYNEGDETIPQMYPDPEAARQDTAILHIHPLNWPRHQFFCCDPIDYRWHESADRLRMKLWSLGIPHEHDLETTGGGHGFEYYSRMADRAVTFIATKLDEVRRQIGVVVSK
ncbi:MAG: esterase family protein [Pirellulaceae bacterium]|jgi:pimeloyl-ACP methyl ester carboxylesterase|nr:esterase family protein [Pirellulaceae bacterium]